MLPAKGQLDGFYLYTEGPFSLSLPKTHGGIVPPFRIWMTAFLLWLPLPISMVISNPAAALHLEVWLRSLAEHARFLFMLPFMVYSAQVLDLRISKVTQHLALTDRSAEKRISRALEKAIRVRDSLWVNIPLVFLALTFLLVRVTLAVRSPSWPSFSVAWSSFVGVSITQWVVILWFTRTIIWTWLLWAFSRTELRVLPAHTDRRGGLGFFNWVQTSFSWATLGFAIFLVADMVGPEKVFGREEVLRVLKVLGVLLLGNVAFFLGPLLFFTPMLCRVKNNRMMEYDRFSDHCVELFERHWVLPLDRKADTEEDPLTHEISAICDLIRVGEQANSMAVVLPDLLSIKRFVLACAIPLGPVFLAKIPAEIWAKILERLFL